MTPSPAAPETPTPPTPSLAEAARRVLDAFGLARRCAELPTGTSWHAVGREAYRAEDCPACALRAALAAEEARDKLRRRAASLYQATTGRRAPMETRAEALRVLAEWAKMETFR